MRLSEALETLRLAPQGRPAFSVTLACGFTPLHLSTFLSAHLSRALPDRTIQVSTGLFGDLCGTLESAAVQEASAVVIALEWPDLDARLGYRSLGPWSPGEYSSIVSGAAAALDRLRQAVERIPEPIPIAVCAPALPLPPVFHTNPIQAAASQLALQAAVAGFLAEIAQQPRVAVVNDQRLAAVSPPGSRLDLRADLLSGFPYSIAHASAAGGFLAQLVRPTAAKKGLITDLDNTLWRGIVGEAGPESVHWDLAGNSQIHGVFQKLLQTLADQGVLLAVASKNQPAVAEQAFARPDLLVAPSQLYPLEIHWEPKSKSIGRILDAWNVSADAVVFVDDDPAELAEVKAARPEIECLRFPTHDEAAADKLFWTLRDRFGKAHLNEEDSIRLSSVRSSATARLQTNQSQETFLAEAEAKMVVEFAPARGDTRPLELVNKTNQFNLNGIRYTEADWRAALAAPEAFSMTVSYQDRFGPLGKIAVLKGTLDARFIEVDTWVMSCRAFCRRIEHRCLKLLFDCFDASEVRLRFAATAKNSPLQEFLRGYVEPLPERLITISRSRFEEQAPRLYQNVEWKSAWKATAGRS